MSLNRFLGIEFDQALRDPYSGERLDARLATAWQEKRPSQELSPFTKEVVAALGYEI